CDKVRQGCRKSRYKMGCDCLVVGALFSFLALLWRLRQWHPVGWYITAAVDIVLPLFEFLVPVKTTNIPAARVRNKSKEKAAIFRRTANFFPFHFLPSTTDMAAIKPRSHSFGMLRFLSRISASISLIRSAFASATCCLALLRFALGVAWRALNPAKKSLAVVMVLLLRVGVCCIAARYGLHFYDT